MLIPVFLILKSLFCMIKWKIKVVFSNVAKRLELLLNLQRWRSWSNSVSDWFKFKTKTKGFSRQKMPFKVFWKVSVLEIPKALVRNLARNFSYIERKLYLEVLMPQIITLFLFTVILLSLPCSQPLWTTTISGKFVTPY